MQNEIDAEGIPPKALVDAMQFVGKLELVMCGSYLERAHPQFQRFFVRGEKDHYTLRKLSKQCHRVTVEFSHHRLRTVIRVLICWHDRQSRGKATIRGELGVTFGERDIIEVSFAHDLSKAPAPTDDFPTNSKTGDMAG